MKAKHSVLALLLLLLFAGGAAVLFFVFRGSDDKQSGQSASTTAKGSAADRTAPQLLVRDAGSATATPPPAGQGRVTVEPVALEGGVISGRVINWSTGEGVDGAELTFTAGGRITTVRADKHGSFELAPPAPGRFSLATIIAPGFLPYAPELEHSPVRLSLAPKQAVRGVTLFLFPALEYTGTVVDAKNAPVAGAKVRLADPPSGEQTLEKIVTEWTTDKQGQFKFNAPDESVFEASRGKQRGWALLDGPVMTTHRMTIMIGDAPARDASIRGKTVDAQGQPLPDVVVVAMPQGPQGPQPGPPHAKKAPPAPRAVAYATSGPDGTFSLDNLDRDKYMLVAELDNHAQARKPDVIGGTHGVTITLDDGLPIGGTVRNASDEPVAAFTLLVTQRRGVVREVVMTRSVIDARGRFEVRVAKGDYELLVSANGWAPSAPLPVAAGTTDAKISLSAGATLVGVVTDAVKGEPVEYARVTREGAGGGASAQPANAGTVTRSDGTFELTGIPAGPFTISIGAGNFHPRLEGGLVATDGGRVGPLKVALQPLAEGEEPKIELVGIGVKLAGDGDALRVDMVAPKSGAEDAGIVAGDHVIAVDNIPVTTLGIDGAVARIRGVAHTKVAVTIKRGDQTLPLSVERKPLRF